MFNTTPHLFKFPPSSYLSRRRYKTKGFAGVQSHSVGWLESASGYRVTVAQSETVMIMISQATPQSAVPLNFL